MKKKLFTILLVLPGMFMTQNVHAADIRSSRDIPAVPAHMPVYSPQVAEMIRYDQVEVNMDTGCIGQTIPLVELNDRDFDFSLSLSYNSSGFCPQVPDNYIGRNWALNGLGVIYRKVNGIPDDIRAYRTNPELSEQRFADGFLRMLGNKKFSSPTLEQDIRNNPYHYAQREDMENGVSTIPGISGDIEACADVFYFSMGKHSGKFMINLDGSISAMGNNGGRYQVSLEDMKQFTSTGAQDTYIRITTDDGYVYTFGGQGYASLEYTALSWREWHNVLPPESTIQARHEITAYYLTEIQAPSGRKLNIKYKDIPAVCHESPYKFAFSVIPAPFDGKDVPLSYSLSGRNCFVAKMAGTEQYMYHGAFSGYNEFSLTKVALVDEISTDAGSVKMYYSSRSQLPDYTSGLAMQKGQFPLSCGAKLDKIVYSSHALGKTVAFQYSYQAGNRMFLTSVNHSKYGKYSFEYNGTNGIAAPTPLTSNIDHWGFWRGRKSNQGIVPGISVLNDYPLNYEITTQDRNPTGEDYDCTLLKCVTYPTGGKTKYTYEPHRYSFLLKQTRSSDYLPDRTSLNSSDNKIAGGARIHEVHIMDSDNSPVKTVVYTYGRNMDNGMVMYMPFYRYTFTMDEGIVGKYAVDAVATNSQGFTDIAYPSVHIRYPEVIEHYMEAGNTTLTTPHPYKVVDFVSYEYGVKWYGGEFIFPTYDRFDFYNPDVFFAKDEMQKIYNKNLFAHPSLDYSLMLDKVKAETYYNSKKEVVKSVNYEYDFLDRNNYVLYFYSPSPSLHLRTGLYMHVGKESFSPYVLKTQIVRTYVPDEPDAEKVDKEWFSHTRFGDLLKHSVLKSSGDTLTDVYDYKYCRQTLLAKHSRLLNGKILDMEELVYDSVRNGRCMLYMPTQILKGIPGKMEIRTRYSHYDTYGNPTVRDEDGVVTIYLWGYRGQYPVAKIENSTYAEVQQALGRLPESCSSAITYESVVATLREKLFGARVSTSKYLFSVGLTGKTDPAGRQMEYNYDSQGRLIETCRFNEQGQRNLTGFHQYHLVNESN